MAPLLLEAYGIENTWKRVRVVNPDDPSGSVSHNKEDGSRDVYMFECSPDDSRSTIYRSKAGIDREIGLGQLRDTLTTGLEVVKELRRGDEPYQMKIKTDKSPQPRLIRFTHI